MKRLEKGFSGVFRLHERKYTSLVQPAASYLAHFLNAYYHFTFPGEAAYPSKLYYANSSAGGGQSRRVVEGTKCSLQSQVLVRLTSTHLLQISDPAFINVQFLVYVRSVKGLYTTISVAPVAYQVIFEPGIGQFREFEPRRVHTRINSLGIFLSTN